MQDKDKSRDQLLHELHEARQRIVQLESIAAGRTQGAGETVEESRERFRTLFETATEGIVITDIQTREVRYANPAFGRILDYEPREVRGKRLDLLLPDEDREVVLEEFDAQARGESLAATNLPWQRKGGPVVFLDATATLGVVGGSECVINFVRDVTERKLAEDEIRKFKAIADHGCFAVAICNLYGVITYANEHLADLLGQPLEKLLDMDFRDLIANGADWGVENLRTLENVELGLLHRNGASIPVLASGVPIGDARGRILNVGFVAVGIARLKETEAQLERSLEQLRKSRDDVVAIVNQFRTVTLMTDPSGSVSFLSDSGLKLLGVQADAVLGRSWQEVLPLSSADRVKVELTMAMPADRRSPIHVVMETDDGRRFWLDIRVHDDPSDPDRKIIFFYDTTEVHDLRQRLDEAGEFHRLTGRSERMQRLFREIREVASVDWTVLVEGETGSGKELVARAIHEASSRKEKPFIPVNCAGLTDSLLGSQLFGHKRGSFTGAVGDQEGVFEAGQGGTVFLDEIGDISPSVQTSLLRVLETREVTRIGENTPRTVDVRILTATHRDLQEKVREGTFRADLLYRVRAARVQVPALRDRRADIPMLATEFLRQASVATGKKVEALSEEAMRMLLEYDWPGNVRELKGAMEFAALHAQDSLVDVDDLPPEVSIDPGPRGLKAEDERERFLAALDQAGGNRSVAARLLGMSRATFYRRLGRLGIRV
jgi:PAS domain S-box-containing protein